MNFQSTDQKSTVYWKVKLWLFGQIQMPKITIHKKMSKYETYSSRNPKFKISYWKVKISKLRNFAKCWKFHVFLQLWTKFSPWWKRIQEKLPTWKLYIYMKYTTFLYTTPSESAWISSYNFKNMWSWNKTLSEISP